MRGRDTITRRKVVLISVTAALLAVPPLAPGRGYPIKHLEFGDNFFSPKHPPAAVLGTDFSWTRQGGSTGQHNIREKHRLFRSGDPAGPGSFDGYGVFPSAGTFKYYCERHVAQGMKGVIKVRPEVTMSATTSGFGVQWALPPAASSRSKVIRKRWGPAPEQQTGSRFDVRYKVNDFRWKIWKNDTRRFMGTFGRDDHPVHVHPGPTYWIEARSEKKHVRKRSGWSPPLVHEFIAP